jgi:hypothetical protein
VDTQGQILTPQVGRPVFDRTGERIERPTEN